MKLYNLVPTDSPFNNWLFWYEDTSGYVRPRQIYADLVCAECGKLDELAAINRGIDPNVRIESELDFLGMSDGFIAVARPVREVFESEGIKGLRFIDFPDQNYMLLWPEVRVATDLKTASFQFVGPNCAMCGRYREVCIGPMSRSLTIPHDAMVVFASDVWNEDTRGRVLWLFAQEPVVRALEVKRLSGLEMITAI